MTRRKLGRRRQQSTIYHEAEEVRFAVDSPLEGAGFEPSVPPTRVISCPATHAEPPENIVRANLGAGGAAQLDLFCSGQIEPT